MRLTPNQITEQRISDERIELNELKRRVTVKPDREIYEFASTSLVDVVIAEGLTFRQAFIFRRFARLYVVKRWKEEDDIHVASGIMGQDVQSIAS